VLTFHWKIPNCSNTTHDSQGNTSETNLHYNYFRYYEPETGRYISPDPIGLAGGLNVYAYVLQNPMSFTDPTGENAVALGLLGLGTIAYVGAVWYIHNSILLYRAERVLAAIH